MKNSNKILNEISYNYIILLFISLLTFIFFYKTFYMGFIYDDWHELRNAAASPYSVIVKDLLPTNGDWRAVSYLIYHTIYIFFGTNPLPYHIVHFIMHIVILWMIYLLIIKLTKDTTIGLVATFLFSVNKAVIYPVTWVAASIDQNLLFFVLITAILYTTAYNTPTQERLKFYTLIILFNIFAWLSCKNKISAYMMPPVYLMLSLIYHNTYKNISIDTLIKIMKKWFFIIWPLFILIAIFIPNFAKLYLTGNGVGGYAASLSPINFIISCSYYVANTIGLEGYTNPNNIYFGFFFLLTLIVYGVCFKRRNIVFGLIWFLITITPAAILTVHHSDHHLYLPLFGYLLNISSCVSHIPDL